MEAFKPSCNLLPLYAHLSRKWCCGLPFSHLEIDHTVSLGREQEANCIACLTYTFQETEVQFFVPTSGLCTFLDPQLNSVNFKDFSGDLKKILLETLQATVAAIFSEWQFSLTPKTAELWEEERICSNLVQCVINREDTPIYSIYINTETIPLNVFDLIFKTIEPSNKGKGLVFPFMLERANTQLLLQEAKTLNLGDVLLVKEGKTYYKFRCKNFVFQGDCEGQTITVNSLIMDENNDLPAGIIPEEIPPEINEDSTEVEETGDEVEEVSETITGQDALQTMPVTITFIAGEQTLSLEQVQQLHEGYTFELDKTPNDTLQILANGRCIGEGEWVQINEHLGVRITQLNLK